MQDLKKLTDDELVNAYTKGNNMAFDEILNRYQGQVTAYIHSIVKNRDAADDLLQETFIKAILTLRQGRYKADGKFARWIIRIAHNAVIDHYRQERSENCISTDCADRDMLNRRDLCDSTVEDRMVSEQICADVRRIMDELPEAQREVIMMRFYADMSFKEIASSTSVSINTALGRMRYAILNMRRIASENRISLTV